MQMFSLNLHNNFASLGTLDWVILGKQNETNLQENCPQNAICK